jgi:hypothetical protein
MRILTWTVDVRVTQRGVRDAVLDAVEVEVAFASELRNPVGRDRILRMVLGRRELYLFAVDSSAGGGKDNLTNAIANAILKESNHPENVNVGVKVRLAYGTSNVHLGRLVAERLGLELLEDFCTPRANIGLVKFCLLRDILVLAA